MTYEEAKELFENYVKDFDLSNDKINYKYNHSYRVAALALEIAKSLNLSPEEIDFAHACGLLHDIGRFYQVSKFDTYRDINSCDHGDIGYDVLKELGVDNEILLKSTKYHNKREIPNDLSEQEELFLSITRDADKLDILQNTCLNVPEDDLAITDEIVEIFRNRSLTFDCAEETDTTQILRSISFIFDINFEYSYKYIKENNLILSKIDNLIKKNKDERLLEIKELIKDYINEGN